MKIEKIDDLLRRCRRQLKEDNGDGCGLDSQVEAVLVHGLLVSICSEFERVLKELFWNRFSDVKDAGVQHCAKEVAKTVIRSAGVDNIYRALKLFGDSSQSRFKEARIKNEEAFSAYGSIVSQRNKAAHGGEVDVTFVELERYYDAGHIVLDWFERSLQGDGG